MPTLVSLETPTAPTLGQVQGNHSDAIEQKVERLRNMESFFKSLPNRRVAAGLGSVQDDIRALAYEDFEAAPE